MKFIDSIENKQILLASKVFLLKRIVNARNPHIPGITIVINTTINSVPNVLQYIIIKFAVSKADQAKTEERKVRDMVNNLDGPFVVVLYDGLKT